MISTDWAADGIKELPLKKLSVKYEKFRIGSTRGYALVEKTMKEIGQVSPISIGLSPNGIYEILDGFKRYHAAENLNYHSLHCRLLKLSVHAQKAAIVKLNHSDSSIRVMEESLILSSLYHEDGLTQPEIAVLFGRHKSWVCRRIAIAEHLCDEAIENLRLGLIKQGVARELSRLPRGNQPKALQTILKHCFTSKETHQLVCLLLKEPSWAHDKILWFPEPILEARTPPKPRDNEKIETAGDMLMAATHAIHKGCKRMEAVLAIPGVKCISDKQWNDLIHQFDKYEYVFNNVRTMLKRPLYATPVH